MITVSATFPTGGTFFSYIKRISDGLFYDSDDDTFKTFGSLVDGEIEFVEDSDISGEYSWELELPDGEYLIFTKQNPGATNAGAVHELIVKFGREVVEANILATGPEFIEMEIQDPEYIDMEVIDG